MPNSRSTSKSCPTRELHFQIAPSLREAGTLSAAAGPALFACGLKKPLDELRARLQNLLSEERERRAMARSDSREATPENETDVEGCVAVFAYLDDTIIGVPPELAGAALTTAVEAFANAGHTVHPGKSACWSHSAEQGTLPECCQRI